MESRAAEPLSITRSIYSKLKHTHTQRNNNKKPGDHVKQKKLVQNIGQNIYNDPKKIEIHNTNIDHAPQQNDQWGADAKA